MGRAGDIVGRLGRQQSTAVVLFHHAVAEYLALGPTDHKCLDLLRERGALTGSALAAITGLTSGAITGVVARLEKAGYVRREPDPDDGRQQILFPDIARMREIHRVFEPIRKETTEMLERFDAHQLTGIAEFLESSTALMYRHVALLRGQGLHGQMEFMEPIVGGNAGKGRQATGPRRKASVAKAARSHSHRSRPGKPK